MAIADPSRTAVRPPAPGRDDPASPLVAEVRHRSRTVIDAELRRLARRAPGLCPADLDIIDAALDELADSLILARLPEAPQGTAPLLRRLFDARR
jgi:hypothetical protein